MSNSQGIVLYAGASLTCQRDALAALTGPEALSEEAASVLPEPTNHRARAS
jgi:hypothetical protein